MKKISIVPTVGPGQALVNFLPAPGLTNNIIIGLNEMPERCTPQEFATYIASHIAGFAYVMHGTNSTETIKGLFTALIDDAGQQFEHRKALIAKEANNPLKYKPS